MPHQRDDKLEKRWASCSWSTLSRTLSAILKSTSTLKSLFRLGLPRILSAHQKSKFFNSATSSARTRSGISSITTDYHNLWFIIYHLWKNQNFSNWFKLKWVKFIETVTHRIWVRVHFNPNAEQFQSRTRPEHQRLHQCAMKFHQTLLQASYEYILLDIWVIFMNITW